MTMKQTINNGMETIIIHHRDLDGVVSALIVKDIYVDARLISTNYGETFDFEQLKDKCVILVDFSFDARKMAVIKNYAEEFIWIDHHKSASKLDMWFDETVPGLRNESGKFAGCELTWKYFHNKKKIPHGVELVGDWDTWTFKYLNDTRVFHECLQIFDIETQKDIIGRVVFSNSSILNEYLNEGKILLKYKDAMVKQLYKKGLNTLYKGHRCFVAHTNVFVSELADYAFRMDRSIEIARIEQTIWAGNKWIQETALRSQGKVDVSEIAEQYGGGGHHNASGFKIDIVF